MENEGQDPSTALRSAGDDMRRVDLSVKPRMSSCYEVTFVKGGKSKKLPIKKREEIEGM